MWSSSSDLNARDLRRAFAFSGDLALCEDRDELDRQVRLLPELVETDTIIIGQVRKPPPGSSAPATLEASDDPPGFFDAEAQEAFARLWHQQPVVVHHFRGFAPQAMKVSDFLGDRAWRRSEVYNDCYGRRLGLTWEMAAQIRCTDEEVACAALQRAEHDFNERDRDLLDLITPHMRAGYARADAEKRAARRLSLLERGLEEHGTAALVVDFRGRIAAAGPRAHAILHDWFGKRRDSTELPERIEEWRAAERGSPAPPVFELNRPGGRLRVRLIAALEEDVILLSERLEERPSARLLARRLPISKREAEVLAAISQGRMTAEIALELGISPHTVNRHIERIYAKLGVHNRSGATAAALGALDGYSTG